MTFRCKYCRGPLTRCGCDGDAIDRAVAERRDDAIEWLSRQRDRDPDNLWYQAFIDAIRGEQVDIAAVEHAMRLRAKSWRARMQAARGDS